METLSFYFSYYLCKYLLVFFEAQLSFNQDAVKLVLVRAFSFMTNYVKY